MDSKYQNIVDKCDKLLDKISLFENHYKKIENENAESKNRVAGKAKNGKNSI